MPVMPAMYGIIASMAGSAPTPPSAPAFDSAARNFADEGSPATKTVTISGTTGDLFLGGVCCVQDRTIIDPSGWGAPIINAAHTGAAVFKVKWWPRILTGAFSNPVFALNMGSDEWCAWVLKITGANAVSPILSMGVGFTNDQTTLSPVSPLATTNGPNRLIIRAFHASGRPPATADAGYPAATTGVFVQSPLGEENVQCTGVAYHTQAEAGSTGTKTWTDVMSGSLPRVIPITIAIRP